MRSSERNLSSARRISLLVCSAKLRVKIWTVLAVSCSNAESAVTYSVRQDTGQVGKEALVNGEKTFGLDGLRETVEHALIEVTRLVVHSRHDRVWNSRLAALHDALRVFKRTRRVHNAGDNKSRRCATGQVQARALFHTQVSCQTSLSEEISGQLDGASETSPHHSSTNATVQTTHTLRLVYLA